MSRNMKRKKLVQIEQRILNDKDGGRPKVRGMERVTLPEEEVVVDSGRSTRTNARNLSN